MHSTLQCYRSDGEEVVNAAWGTEQQSEAWKDRLDVAEEGPPAEGMARTKAGDVAGLAG